MVASKDQHFQTTFFKRLIYQSTYHTLLIWRFLTMPERFNISIGDLHCLSAIPISVVPGSGQITTDGPTNLPATMNLFFDVGFVQGGQLHLTMKRDDSFKLMGELAVQFGFKLVTVPHEAPRLEPYITNDKLTDLLSLAISCIPPETLPKPLLDYLDETSMGTPNIRDTQRIPNLGPCTCTGMVNPGCPYHGKASSKPPSTPHPQTEPVDDGEPL
jgi:hypothetical protein